MGAWTAIAPAALFRDGRPAFPSMASSSTFLQQRRIHVLAATPSAQAEYTRQDLRAPLAVAVGTEDEGLSQLWMDHADVRVKIPMMGRVNSLNVSIATALIVYEAVRQRQL